MKILFVGLGSIGQRHLRNLNQVSIKNKEIYYYSELNRNLFISKNLKYSSKSNLETKYQIIKITNKKDILKIKPDVSFICNPSSKHIDYAILLAKLGSHIFLEKPLSNNLNNIRLLKKILIKKNLIFYVGYQMKFHPYIRKMKELILKKTYGNILFIKANFGQYLENFHKYESLSNTIYGKKKLGGGVILEISHELDYLIWLLDPKSINLKSFNSKSSNLNIDVEDVSSSIFVFKIKDRKVILNLNLDFLQFKSQREIILCFEKATIKVDFEAFKFEIIKKHGRKTQLFSNKKFSRDHIFINQLKYFFNCIKINKKPSLNNLESALNTLKLSLEMKKKII